jgi:hypothetical protein
MKIQNEIKFGGLSKVEMSDSEFDLGEGIFIRKTYAHLFAPFMIAFKPPGENKIHGAPWKAAKGGIAFDILVEIEMPVVEEFKTAFDQEEMIWIIASLIRLYSYPYLIISAISDISFNKILDSEKEPVINPYETKHRIFNSSKDVQTFLREEHLNWLKENWQKTMRLLKTDSKFFAAFKAFDSAAIFGNPTSSLLTTWGAIEQLFSPNTGELKYRVSANLASFLEKPGIKRLELFKELSKLYNDRSLAAHTSKQLDHKPLVNSWVHLRNALMKIIEMGKVPSQDDLQELIFNPEINGA